MIFGWKNLCFPSVEGYSSHSPVIIVSSPPKVLKSASYRFSDTPSVTNCKAMISPIWIYSNLSNPKVMSMKKKMIAQKKEKGIDAIASLDIKSHEKY